MARNSSLITLIFSLAQALYSQSTLNQTIIAAGLTRTFIVHIPSDVTNPPLVLNMHGQGGTAEGMRNTTKMDAIAEREKFIVVYPNAIKTNGVEHSWDYFGEHEFAFLKAIIDTVDKQFHIDRNKIYSMGFSQGGVMSFHLACRYANEFAAIAPTSQYLWDTSCKPARSVPMRLTFGTKDFAPSSKFMETVNKWLVFDSCPRTPVVTKPYPSSNSKSLVTRLFYGPCASGADVVVDSIKTGTHQWQMNTETMINNSEESWAFLKKFSLNRTTLVANRWDLNGKDEISASYRAGFIRFHGIQEQFRASVFDIRNRLIKSTTVTDNLIELNYKASGIYLIIAETKKGPRLVKALVP